MRVTIQRVSRASVTIDGKVVGAIGAGLLVLAAIGRQDGETNVEKMASRIPRLRLFPGPTGHFDRSLLDIRGEGLVVSQFTLYADIKKGTRPSFSDAARPEQAEPLLNRFVELLRQSGLKVAEGKFGALMQVELVNDGPVTLNLES